MKGFFYRVPLYPFVFIDMAFLLHILSAFVGASRDWAHYALKKPPARGAECLWRHDRMDAAAQSATRQTTTFKEECHVIGHQQ